MFKLSYNGFGACNKIQTSRDILLQVHKHIHVPLYIMYDHQSTDACAKIDIHVLYSWKFSPEKISPILPPGLVGKILRIFCPVLTITSTDHMATFTILAKIYSIKYYCNRKVT